MLVRDFDYQLPAERIAQAALTDRAASRMLAFNRDTGTFDDENFRDIPELLRAGDLLIINDTRVLPARLFARRAGSHTQSTSAETPTGNARLQGRVEVLLTEQHSEWEWSALAKPGRKLPVGAKLHFCFTGSSSQEIEHAPVLIAEIIGRGEFGERRLRFEPVKDFHAVLDLLGHMPLPPYIRRPDNISDRERYQTIFASERGSVAAPTAGLHFTSEILAAIRAKGVKIANVTLHVGLGTFQPVRVDRLEDIRLHVERYTLSAETAREVNAAKREGRRVIAIGTTTVRVLEHCAQLVEDGMLSACSGETQMFISPGYKFRIVTGLLTNFHLPQSTLLMLVCAFGGKEAVLAAYKHAVAKEYRFFSYGDCMFLA